MVEGIDGAHGELDVALGIDVIQDFQGDVGDILNVDVFVYYDDAFGKHGLAQRPDRIHDFAGLSGIGFADGDEHQVVKDAFDGKIDVDEFGNRELHQGQENALDGLAHPSIFLRRLADHGGRVNRILPVSDAGDVEDGIFVFERVEAGVISEGALGAEFIEVDVAFKDDFGVGGNFKIDGLALYEFDGLLTEESGDDVFLDIGRGWDDGGEGQGRVGADGNGDLHLAGGAIALRLDGTSGRSCHDVDGGGSPTQAKRRLGWGTLGVGTCLTHVVAVVFGGHFLALPVHSGGALVVDLHTIHSDIPFASFRIAGDDAGQGDEASPVLGPALQDGEIEEREIVALDDFFAGAGRNRLREKLAHLGEHGEHFDFIEETLGRFDVREGADAVGDLIEFVDIEREAHAAGRAELVDQEFGAGIALQVFEEKRFAANDAVFILAVFAFAFGNAVGNLCDFQDRISFSADAFQFAGSIEGFDPVA